MPGSDLHKGSGTGKRREMDIPRDESRSDYVKGGKRKLFRTYS